MIKKILPIIAIVALFSGGIGYYFYQKPHTKTDTLEAEFQKSASDLFAEFEADETTANTKYLDKIIEVSGTIQESSLEAPNILKVTLAGGNPTFGVICEMENADKLTNTYKEGQQVTFKGICTGMLMDVVLVRCVEVKR